MPLRQISLYTRPGCHLCEDAAELLEHLAARFPIEVAEVNIMNDVDLFERYRHSIPVVAIAGGPTMPAPIQAEALERVLKDCCSTYLFQHEGHEGHEERIN